ncbi:MAG: M56 family metallopeptidase [Thermoanaerobaculia bacterium]
MTTIQDAVLGPVGWALVHFLWQGTLVVLLVAAVLRLLRTATAEARYVTACAGLCLMLALPLVTAFAVGAGGDVASSSVGSVAGVSASRPALAPATVERALLPVPAIGERLEPLLPWLLAVWVLGVVLLTAVHLGGWRRVRQLRRDTRPVPERWQAALTRLTEGLAIARKVTLLESARIGVPMVVGWLRPAILVPVSAFAGLSPSQLEAILAHELAHVRRRDDLVNLLQTAVETLLFYHPGVWWVSRQIRAERENCCDDLAVRICGSPVAYARALTDLEQLRPSGTPAFALGADGGSLLGRVRRLVGRRPPARHGWLEVVTAGMVAALVAMVGSALLWVALPTSAMPPPQAESQAAEPPAEPTPPEPPAEPTPPEPPQQAESEVSGDVQEAVDDLRRAIDGTSYQGLTDDDLMLLVEEGLDDDDVRELERAGYSNLSLDELAMLAREGVDGDDVRELYAAGYGSLSVDELAMLAREGVDGDDVRELQQAGFENLTIDELLMFAREGVDGDDLRGLSEAGYTSLSVEEVLMLAREGVDGDDVRELRQAGFADLSLEELLMFAREGVDGDDLREMSAAGYDNLSVEEVLMLAREGVDGDDLRELGEAGIANLSLEEMLRLAREGVDGDDVRELGEAGLENLTVEELLRLAREGVDGDDVREMRDAGYDNLTVDRILELARHGDF